MGMKILIDIFFSLKTNSRTRGHEVTLVKLAKDQCRLDIRKYSFSQRQSMNGINHLDCLTVSSVNILKTRLTRISGEWVTHRLKMLDPQ